MALDARKAYQFGGRPVGAILYEGAARIKQRMVDS